jgi:thiaminase (transcriptional activator TenA)
VVRAQDLFDHHRTTAEACRDHPFVTGIADGTLQRAAFVFYVGQDAVFLDAFARGYALGVAKAPDRSTMSTWKGLLDGALDELRLHRTYAERWGAPLDPEPAPATAAYTDFLLRVAALEPPGHLAAAMTPCMRLYAWLGAQLVPRTSDASPYREWVDTYADPEFEALASTLEGELDRLDGAPAVVAAHYGKAMRLELAFFDAAWRVSR